jgi:hypothetical protein
MNSSAFSMRSTAANDGSTSRRGNRCTGRQSTLLASTGAIKPHTVAKHHGIRRRSCPFSSARRLTRMWVWRLSFAAPHSAPSSWWESRKSGLSMMVRRGGYLPGVLTFIRLVRTYSVDLGEGFGEVVGWGFGGGEGVASGLDRDGAVSAGATHEFLDAPTGLVLDPVGYG